MRAVPYSAVTTDRDGGLPAFTRQRTESVPDAANDIGGQGLVDDATNVVGFENFGGQGSRHLKPHAKK